MGPADRLRQGLVRRRHSDKVNVVRHQAETHHLQPVPRALPTQNPKIHAVVVVREKHVLAVVPALGHMMRQVRDDDASHSWHRRQDHYTPRTGQEKNR
jgi:hypothetical protein